MCSFREPTYDQEFQHFLRGREIVLGSSSVPKISGLSEEQVEGMVRLSNLPAFRDVIGKVEADDVSRLVASCVQTAISTSTFPTAERSGLKT